MTFSTSLLCAKIKLPSYSSRTNNQQLFTLIENALCFYKLLESSIYLSALGFWHIGPTLSRFLPSFSKQAQRSGQKAASQIKKSKQ